MWHIAPTTIWAYTGEDDNPLRVKRDIDARLCVYCGAMLDHRVDEHDITYQEHGRRGFVTEKQRLVKCCPACGWWLVRSSSHFVNDGRLITDWTDSTHGACGVLRAFDIASECEPLSEVRQYLAAKYDARFDINPTRFEEVVVSVYRDLGYDVEATGRTGDGGIDAVLRKDAKVVGVQVKRVHGKIEAEHIRSFAGALYLKGMLGGVYVTTSTFTRGARDTVATAAHRIPIVLVDAAKFYDQLGLAQRRTYDRAADLPAEIVTAKLIKVYYSTSRP